MNARLPNPMFTWRPPWWPAVLAIVCTVCGAPAPLSAQRQQAWEYDDYRVLVWLAHDRCPPLTVTAEQLRAEAEQLTVALDPTSWVVAIKPAPRPWDHRLLSGLRLDDHGPTLLERDDVRDADKLTLVSIAQRQGFFEVRARELDLRTQQWGAIVSVRAYQLEGLPQAVASAIAQAFMPLARIERVFENEVQLRVRAAGLCERAEVDDVGNWYVVTNFDSPVWVRDDDVLMPVIRRVDRRGALQNVQPVERTFLSIVDHQSTLLTCRTHSMHRAPLSGRTGSRIEKLALVIRAPDRSTNLVLVSRGAEARPLAGLDVWSRSPFQSPDEPSTRLGKTDWQGTIEIPPADENLRVLFVKSGERALARVPVVPGLYDRLRAEMPNDEKRLYAEGVVRGLQNELMDLVARRRVLAAEIDKLLIANRVREARDVLNMLRDIPDSVRYNAQLVNEEKKLQSSDANEMQKISKMFDELRLMSSQHLSSSLETALSQKINDALSGETRPQSVD